jgi:hypothetical protein
MESIAVPKCWQYMLFGRDHLFSPIRDILITEKPSSIPEIFILKPTLIVCGNIAPLIVLLNPQC